MRTDHVAVARHRRGKGPRNARQLRAKKRGEVAPIVTTIRLDPASDMGEWGMWANDLTNYLRRSGASVRR